MEAIMSTSSAATRSGSFTTAMIVLGGARAHRNRDAHRRAAGRTRSAAFRVGLGAQRIDERASIGDILVTAVAGEPGSARLEQGQCFCSTPVGPPQPREIAGGAKL